MDEKDTFKVVIGIGAFVVLGIVLFTMFAVPILQVWWAQQDGKAELAQAEQNRQIAIKEAEANLESEKLNALAEIERAKGVAEANKIIGESLQDSEAYLRYLWIQGLQDGSSETIYIPTEANLPLLEANRR